MLAYLRRSTPPTSPSSLLPARSPPPLHHPSPTPSSSNSSAAPPSSSPASSTSSSPLPTPLLESVPIPSPAGHSALLRAALFAHLHPLLPIRRRAVPLDEIFMRVPSVDTVKSFCNIVLADGLPSKRSAETIIVKCGLCDNISFFTTRFPAHYQPTDVLQLNCQVSKSSQFMLGEEDYKNFYSEEYSKGKDGELTWFNAGVRVGVGVGLDLGICLGVGIGVGVLVRTYQATSRQFRRR